MAGIFLKQYRYYIVILAGIVIGTLAANLLIDNVTEKISIFTTDFNNAFINVKLDKELYLKYVLELRLKEYICLLLVMFTPVCLLGTYAFMLYAGVSMGIMVSVSVMNMGLKGMLAYAVCIVPQYIIYAITVFLLVSCTHKRQERLRKTVMLIVASLIVLILGVLYESYISPLLIKCMLN